MIPSDLTQMKIANWRDRARQGLLTQDECREAIQYLREARGSAPQPTSAPRRPAAASKPAIISGDDLLKDFGI